MSASASPFARADARLADAVAGGAFPCAVVEIGTSAGHVWRSAHGTLTGQAEDAAASPHTVFDLASLTKVLATTTLAMQLSDRGLLGLDQRMTDWIPRWRGADREDGHDPRSAGPRIRSHDAPATLRDTRGPGGVRGRNL